MKNITDQNGLIVIADIDANKLSILCNELQLLHTAIINKADHPFGKIKGIHFARFVIFPDPLSAQPPGQLFRLVYSGTYDGPLDAYLQAMTAGETISPFQRIFSCCKDYDPAMPPATAITTFIKGHTQRVDAYYSGYRGLSTDMIGKEAEIYTLIQQFLRERTFAATDDPKFIKQEIVQYLHQQAPGYNDIKAVPLPYIKPVYAGLLIALLLIGVLVLAGIVHLYLLAAFVVLIAGIVFYLRRLEQTAPELPDTEQEVAAVPSLTKDEDFYAQNQLSHLVAISPGGFRLGVLRAVLWLINLLAKYSFNKGALGGISTIHFAGWSILEKERTLLFFSNFDGSWENYLSDFVDRAAVGLTGVWSNTVNFPRTSWLVFKGAADEERFKNWTRKYQIHTQVWYSAFEELTVKNIWRNHRIALGLNQEMNDMQTKQWLNLL